MTKTASKKQAVGKPARPTATKLGRVSSYTKPLEKVAALKVGVWRELRTYDSVTGAKDALHRFRHKRLEVPAGSWEFKAEHDRDTNTSRLLVRYMGDGENILRWYRGADLVEKVPAKERKAKKAGAQKRWAEPAAG